MTSEDSQRHPRLVSGGYPDNKISLRLAFRPFRDAFQFGGRSTRTEVIAFYLLSMLAGLVAFSWDSPASPIGRAVASGWALLWSWPWLPLLVRRLHDQDRPAWWSTILVLSVVFWAIAWRFAPAAIKGGMTLSLNWGAFRESRQIAFSSFSILLLAAIACSAIAVIVLYLLGGTPGANRYGEDPRL